MDGMAITEEEQHRISRMLVYERSLWEKGVQFIAGIDEAGRGPLAGPVVAAAVIFHPDTNIPGINDSKKLTANRRQQLLEIIQQEAVEVTGLTKVHFELMDLAQFSTSLLDDFPRLLPY